MLSRKVTNYLIILTLFIGHITAFENPFSFKKEPEKLDLDMNDWQTRLEFARLLSYMKKYEASLDEYDKLLKINPQSRVARFEMARIYYYQKNYQAALALLNNMPAAGTDKFNAEEASLLAADINLALKQYAPAEQILRAHIQNHPEDLASKYKLAQVLSWQKKYQEAVPLFEQILQERPNNTQVRRQYGMVLMWMGNFEAAAQQLESTLPEQRPVLDNP